MDKTVLVIAAHPDDEVLGCGGAILRHSQEGDEVFVIIAAEGFTSRQKERNREKVSNELNNLVVSANKAVLNSSDEGEGIRVKSPIIGTAYLAPEPGAKKFVEIGDKIKKGQTVMIVEAMKTMNHVPSTADGEVKKILIEDGQPVEFGQTLVLLK